jgi:Protein of unknown function (DUF1203)
MDFRITGLSANPFRPLFGLPDDELARCGARRYVADVCPGFPDRVELRDAEPGERLILVNHLHLPHDTPYRASHAIFVLENAQQRFDRVGEVPPALRVRLLSLRAFDAAHMMVDADVVHGREAEPVIERLLGDPRTAYLHAHYAKAGCYAAHIERVSLTAP